MPTTARPATAYHLHALKPQLASAVLALDAAIRRTLPANPERQLALRELQDCTHRLTLAAEWEASDSHEAAN